MQKPIIRDLKFKHLSGLIFIVLASSALALFINRSSSNISQGPITVNQLAIVSEDPNVPYVVEKTDSGIKVVSQPFNFIATADGKLYCKNGETQLKQNTISSAKMQELSRDVVAGVNQISDRAEPDNPSVESIMAFDGSDLTTSLFDKSNAKYSEVVEAVKQECEGSGSTDVEATELPQFQVPDVGGMKDYTAGSSLLKVITPPTRSYTTEKDQLDNINFSRWVYQKPPGVKRSSCMDSVSVGWSKWMAAVSLEEGYEYYLAHNPNFLKDILKSCKNPNWKKMGENVGYGSGSKVVFDAFMASEGHKANILNQAYTLVGLGSYYTQAKFKNLNDTSTRYYITQNFMGLF